MKAVVCPVKFSVVQEMKTRKSSSRDKRSSCGGESTDMMEVLLLTSLLLTGVTCEKQALFVYRRLGGEAVLPCTGLLSPDCSFVSWTFYKGGRLTEEILWGQVRAGSDKSRRLSLTPDCSLHLRDLRVEDAGSYMCLNRGNAIVNVYLSLLSIASLSAVTDLHPGGNLTLSCVLFTYYDAGNCRSYSSVFSLGWTAEDGAPLPADSRYELIGGNRCNITLLIKLQREDNNRKWRCQVNTTENSSATFLDFTSAFLFENPENPATLPANTVCPVELPISRIMLCVALPVMVIIVGVYTRKEDRKRAKASAAGIEIQEIN